MARPAPRAHRFGAYVKQLRELRDEPSLAAVTTQMAALVGVRRHPSALFKCEEEGRVPGLDLLRGMSAVYRVPIVVLIDKLLDELRVAPINWRAELDGYEQKAGSGSAGAHVAPPALSTEVDSIISLVGELVVTGERLKQIAEAVFGRHVATAGHLQPVRPQRYSAARRGHPRARRRRKDNPE